MLKTKLHIPKVPNKQIHRYELLKKMDEGLDKKLILISASAGFGKTTLVCEWISKNEQPIAWISLDNDDNDPVSFLTYFISALQAIHTDVGKDILAMIQSPQIPSFESILTILLNEITNISDNFTIVFDDYHVINNQSIDKIFTFLLEHMPPQMHFVITTREDPNLSLSKLRVRGELTELRAKDLRFNFSESTAFLNKLMKLNLSKENITSLESRTEGWIAGLQLAAISMQGLKDSKSFIESFAGSHHFVLDYLVEEVLTQQPVNIQNFLLKTSILDRLCKPLCEAVLFDNTIRYQETLEYLERANLFIVPLDNERYWYRYHHLFADFLKQRLFKSNNIFTNDNKKEVENLHKRASIWYKNNGLDIESFHHAVESNDIEFIEHVMEGDGMPLPFQGAVVPVLNWLKSLSIKVLDSRPLLWVTYASTLLATGHVKTVEQKLQSAEKSLQNIKSDNKTNDLIGRIAAIRATAAIGARQIETMIVQSRKALDNLDPQNLSFRTSTIWKLGVGYHIQGDYNAAKKSYSEVISICQISNNVIFNVLSITGLGNIQEIENQLYLARETYQQVLDLIDDNLLLFACNAHIGLARIYYEWNDFVVSQNHIQKCIDLVRQIDSIDTFIDYCLLYARLKLAQGDDIGATTLLEEANQFIERHNFLYRSSEIVDLQVLILLNQGELTAADKLINQNNNLISQVRILLAQGNAFSALEVLEPLYNQIKTTTNKNEILKIMVLQSVGLHMNGENDKAMKLISELLSQAEPNGFVRIFLDEGLPMLKILSDAVSQNIMPNYVNKLLAAFGIEKQKTKKNKAYLRSSKLLIDPLSPREIEVLQLIAQGLSNHQICERLFLALSTVKGHNKKIFDKLQVKRRTEAVVRANELGIL